MAGFNLQDPIVPVADTSALDYVAKGLAGMVANRKYQQSYELAQQKMVQDAALDQQKFQLAREKLAGDMQVQQAQIGNLNAEANYHNAQANFVTTTKTEKAKEKQDLLNMTSEYTAKANKIKGSELFGTPAGETALAALGEEYSAISNIPAGSKQLSSFSVGQRIARSQKSGAILKLGTNLEKQMAEKGLTSDHLNELQMDDQGNFKAGGIWQVNKDGTPYVDMMQSADPTKAGPEILTKAQVASYSGKKHRPIVSVTLPLQEARVAKYSKNKMNDWAAQVAGMPSIGDVHEAAQGAMTEAAKQQAVDKIKQDFAAGVISQDDALNRVRALGFK